MQTPQKFKKRLRRGDIKYDRRNICYKLTKTNPPFFETFVVSGVDNLQGHERNPLLAMSVPLRQAELIFLLSMKMFPYEKVPEKQSKLGGV